jgi:acyl-CoA reductase-like NAD-dependent aldehyde dehydrogenase
MKRAEILKTYKLYLNGKFPRSESGHYFQVQHPKTKKVLANVSRASRKDLRDAVKAARGAFAGWSKTTAYLRGQILYRMAEMMEARQAELVEQIVLSSTQSRAQAQKEVLASIDRMIWYAGWSDKYQQIFGTVNPVALPYFNFTMPEPTGVVGILVADELPLLPLVSQLAPVIVSGNSCVVVASEKYPLVAVTFAEILNTSDLPAGVVNILTGFKEELADTLAKHMDVNAVHALNQRPETASLLQREGIANLKRVVLADQPRGAAWFAEAAQSPYAIESFVEMKTTWHPVGV